MPKSESHLVRNVAIVGLSIGAAGLGLGYCSEQFGFNESEEGRGTRSELTLPASELETSLGVLAVTNDIELRVTHDIEAFGETADLYTDVFPATVPGFVEFKVEDMPQQDIDDQGTPAVTDDRVTVTIDRGDIFLQERAEQLQDSVTFRVEDGKLAEGSGLPIEVGTRVALDDGEYQTGQYSFDPEEAESIFTKLGDAITFGFTDINSGTAENVTRLGQLAALNPACIRAVEEGVGIDNLIAASFQDMYEARGAAAENVTVEFEGEYPEDFGDMPDESGVTFNEYTENVEASLEGDNQKQISFSSDCNADGTREPNSQVRIANAR